VENFLQRLGIFGVYVSAIIAKAFFVVAVL